MALATESAAASASRLESAANVGDLRAALEQPGARSGIRCGQREPRVALQERQAVEHLRGGREERGLRALTGIVSAVREVDKCELGEPDRFVIAVVDRLKIRPELADRRRRGEVAAVPMQCDEIDAVAALLRAAHELIEPATRIGATGRDRGTAECQPGR